MRFFLDNNLPPRWARALNVLDDQHEVMHLRDRFLPSVTDVEWMETLSSEGGWIVLTADERIRTKPQEREVWRRAKLTTFFLQKGWRGHRRGDYFWDTTWRIIRYWPEIADSARKYASGSAFILPYRIGPIRTV